MMERRGYGTGGTSRRDACRLSCPERTINLKRIVSIPHYGAQAPTPPVARDRSTMAKNLVDFIDFNYSESKDFVDAVTKEIWTINYWQTGKKLAAALEQAGAGKVRFRYFSQCAFKD